LRLRIGFLTIAQVAGEVLEEFLQSGTAATAPDSFEAVFEIDRLVRDRTVKRLRLAA
jgi:hypothetical protein